LKLDVTIDDRGRDGLSVGTVSTKEPSGPSP
jgi:hypothetical protein